MTHRRREIGRRKLKVAAEQSAPFFIFSFFSPPFLVEEMLSGTKRSPAFICLSRFSWWSNRTISLLHMTKRRIENYLLLYLSSSDLVAEAIRAQISNYCRLSTIYHPGPMGSCTEAGRDCTTRSFSGSKCRRGCTKRCTQSHVDASVGVTVPLCP